MMKASRWMTITAAIATVATTVQAQRPDDRNRSRSDDRRAPPPCAQMNRGGQRPQAPAWGRGTQQNERPDMRSFLQNRPMLREFAERNPELAKRIRDRIMQREMPGRGAMPWGGGQMGRGGSPWGASSGRGMGAPWMGDRGPGRMGMQGPPPAMQSQPTGPCECPRCHFRFGPSPRPSGRPAGPEARPQDPRAAPGRPPAKRPEARPQAAPPPPARSGARGLPGCGDCDRARGCDRSSCGKAQAPTSDRKRDADDRAAPRRGQEKGRGERTRGQRA
jgi:hypothetical protein